MSGASLPHSHDPITSSTATTAQSSSESTINKQEGSIKRASAASILSPQSERWTLGQQNYFQEGSEFCSGLIEGTSKEGKSGPEYHELSNKECFNKFGAPIKSPSRGSMDINKYTNKITQRRILDGNLLTTSDCIYGENKNTTYCANPKSPFIETECIAEGSFHSDNGGSSKQTAI